MDIQILCSVSCSFLLSAMKVINISRYVSTAPEEEIVDIEEVRQELEKIESDISQAKAVHNEFLKELGLKPVSYTHLTLPTTSRV